jgi:hypothetical protein
VSAVPHSSQNLDAGLLSAAHFGQRWDSGLPHSAQNLLLVVLSVPHLVQRMRLIPRVVMDALLYHPAARGDQQTVERRSRDVTL